VECGWKSLAPEELTGPGDVPVTTDLRTILGDVLRARDPGLDLRKVFPRSNSAKVSSTLSRRCCDSPLCTHG
jgi:hypothetical protein